MAAISDIRIIATQGAISGSREICQHYCRTGRCKHASSCRYVHDRSKVALCRANLRKECPKSRNDCELSHDLDPNRMPECGLFLRNLCVDPDCRYLHVKKAQSAPDCEEFKTSWCPLGAQCPKRHYVPPTAPEKKRQREDEQESEEDEDEMLRRTWEETPTLKMYD